MKVNKYSGTCKYCQGHVEARAGILVPRSVRGRKGGRWAVAHLACAQEQSPQVATTVFSSGAVVTRNVRGRCIDAPCCGCCSG